MPEQRLLIFAPNIRAGDHAGRYELQLPSLAYRLVTEATNLCGYQDQPVHVVNIPGVHMPPTVARDLDHGLATGAFRMAIDTDIAAIRDAHAESSTSS